MGKILMLKDVRLSFPVLDDATEYKLGDGKPRWGAVALVRIEDPQKALVDKAIQEVANEEWGAKATAYLANIFSDSKMCAWQPGARKSDYDGYQGCYSLSSYRERKKGPPLVMLADQTHVYYRGDPKTIPEGTNPAACVLNREFPGLEGKIYSGCYVNMQVEIWAQNNTNGKGIRSTLLGVQFWRTGDAFGGGRAPDQSAFPDMVEGADAESLAD